MPSAELKMIIESRAQHWKRESALSPCSSVVALTAQRTSEDAWTCSVWSIELSTYAEVTAAGDQAATASSAHPRRMTSPESSKRAPASLVASGERRLRHFREGPESEKKDDELQVRGGRRLRKWQIVTDFFFGGASSRKFSCSFFSTHQGCACDAKSIRFSRSVNFTSLTKHQDLLCDSIRGWSPAAPHFSNLNKWSNLCGTKNASGAGWLVSIRGLALVAVRPCVRGPLAVLGRLFSEDGKRGPKRCPVDAWYRH